MKKKNSLKEKDNVSGADPENILATMSKNRAFRTELARRSHHWHFLCYFPHYIKHGTASFQREIFQLTEREDVKNLFICGFRGCAKSTILSLSFPIWSILGKRQKKFVVIVCQTQAQAKQRMMNLRQELEQNQLLKNDLGPFSEESNEWGSSTLVFSNYGARITAASMEQSIRGLIHGPYRPDLIILDDVEDMDSTRTKEGRDKAYNKLKGDIIPAGDQDTQLVIVGNLLHEDSLLMRIKREVKENIIEGDFKEYPLIDENGNCLWPGKYPDSEAIEAEKKKVGNDIAWQREYLLHIVPPGDQVIPREWIQYYDGSVPADCRVVYIGVDIAKSMEDTADYTAMVCIGIRGYGKDFRAYVFQHPLNKRIRLPETLEQIQNLYGSLKKSFKWVNILIESVGTQGMAAQILTDQNYPAEEVRVVTDKRTRLMIISHLIQNGRILFPRHGSEDLIQQIVGLGVERFDDLADALTIIGGKLIDAGTPYIKPSEFFKDSGKKRNEDRPITAGLMDMAF